MKIEEIMVGDYLRVNRDVCIKKGTIVEVRGIDADNRFENHTGCASCHPLDDNQFDGGIWVDYLDPIPLTAEILEKNGFELNSNMFGLCDYELSESYILENRGDRFSFVKRIPGHKSTFHIIDIKYVHELQHALRLCGIEKEIKL